MEGFAGDLGMHGESAEDGRARLEFDAEERHLNPAGTVHAVELTCAARGLEVRAPLRPAPGTAAALAAIRELIPGLGPDRYLSPELAAVEALVASGGLVETVESAIGALQ